MENNQTGCINRDKNSVRNMKKITHEFLEKGTRPERYRRTHPQKCRRKRFCRKKQETPTPES